MPKFLNPERDTCECGAPRATWQSQCTACQVEADGIAPAVYFEPFRKLPPVGTPSVYAVTALHIPDCPIKFGNYILHSLDSR